MRKHLLAAVLFASSTLLSSGANAGPSQAGWDAGCMLHSGCFFDSGTLQWVCADPSAYMLCLEP